MDPQQTAPDQPHCLTLSPDHSAPPTVPPRPSARETHKSVSLPSLWAVTKLLVITRDSSVKREFSLLSLQCLVHTDFSFEVMIMVHDNAVLQR